MTEIIRLGAASLSTAIIILGMVHIDALYERSRETNFYTERRFKKKKRLHQPASLERALWIHMLNPGGTESKTVFRPFTEQNKTKNLHKMGQ